MSTTPARRARRAAAQAVQLKVKSNSLIVKDLRDLYREDPNKALDFAFEVVGKEKYQHALQCYLHDHMAPVAFVLAMKRCLA